MNRDQIAEVIAKLRRHYVGAANELEDDLGEAISLLLAMQSDGWQTMDSAPRDGRAILTLCRHRNHAYSKPDDRARWQEIVIARWIDHNGGGWTWHGIAGEHIAWRPLPQPPGDAG